MSCENPNLHDEVIDFIERRFEEDSKWVNENSYYLAVILSNRFKGDVYCDTEKKHFVSRINGKYYDYHGIYETKEPLIYFDSLSYSNPSLHTDIKEDFID